MATLTQYTLPIYEAVVCNLTLEKLQQEEGDEKLLALASQSLVLSKEIIRMLTEADFSAVPAGGTAPVAVGLCVLVWIGRQAFGNTRKLLPQVCDKYRTALAAVLDQLDAAIDRLAEIAEGWYMACDESITKEIKQALSLSGNRNDEEIPDWRKILAPVSD